MLDVTLRNVAFAFHGSPFAVRDVSVTFAKSTHTAIIGPPASGVSTLLRLVAGALLPDSGSVAIGARDVTRVRRARRPLLYATAEIDAPGRWSVRHLLVAAARQRSLDRIDRQREVDLAIEKWRLADVLDRPLGTLSTSQKTFAHAARVELLKPAIFVADRFVEHFEAADALFRTLRILGTTVITAPDSWSELGFSDRVIVIEQGRIAQEGTFSQVYRSPATEGAAIATGAVNVIPVSVRGNSVASPIGSWELASSPFQGDGVAVARPHDFTIAERGEDSDVIFGIEEATFHGDHWLATGILTGNLSLRVALPADTPVHKGRLLALRYDANRFALFRR